MGTFLGHVQEGVAFLILGYWWMYNMFRDYRHSIKSGEAYRSRVSYVVKIGKRRVPVESYLKILFPAIIFITDMCTTGLPVRFIDENNRFIRMRNLQHMSIYGIFFLHGLTDLLSYYKIQIMREMKYITGMVAFLWYGIQMYYHSSESTHKPPLERMLHRFQIPTTAIVSLMFLWEMRQREIITPQLIRCLWILISATWFNQTAYCLYAPAWSGGRSNPDWDGYDMHNVHIVAALYGFHIMFNIIITLVFYGLISTKDQLLRFIRRVLGREDSNICCEYRKLQNGEDEDEGTTKLLMNKVTLQYQDSTSDEHLFDA